MWWLLAVPFAAALLTFALLVLVGPPYLPTLRRQTDAALDLLNLKPGQTMLELGSGDGRVMRAAAARGWHVVGIELNPFLVLVSRIVTWRYRDRVQVLWGSYFGRRWPEAQGIFAFMLPRYMGPLDRHIREQYRRPVRLASFAFKVPDREVTAAREGVFLYEYK